MGSFSITLIEKYMTQMLGDRFSDEWRQKDDEHHNHIMTRGLLAHIAVPTERR